MSATGFQRRRRELEKLINDNVNEAEKTIEEAANNLTDEIIDEKNDEVTDNTEHVVARNKPQAKIKNKKGN